MIIKKGNIKKLRGSWSIANFHFSHLKCADIADLFNDFSQKGNIQAKMTLVNHIYSCDSCRLQFQQYIFLLDAISCFSMATDRIMRSATTLNQGSLYIRCIFSRFLSHLPMIISVTGMALLLLSDITTNRTNSNSATVQFRSISSQYYEIFPEPFSTISINKLHFRWGATVPARQRGVHLYDSSLSLIWESAFSEDNFTLPPNHIKNKLKSGVRYYWSIISRSLSETTVYSYLIPFSIYE